MEEIKVEHAGVEANNTQPTPEAGKLRLDGTYVINNDSLTELLKNNANSVTVEICVEDDAKVITSPDSLIFTDESTIVYNENVAGYKIEAIKPFVEEDEDDDYDEDEDEEEDEEDED